MTISMCVVEYPAGTLTLNSSHSHLNSTLSTYYTLRATIPFEPLHPSNYYSPWNYYTPSNYYTLSNSYTIRRILHVRKRFLLRLRRRRRGRNLNVGLHNSDPISYFYLLKRWFGNLDMAPCQCWRRWLRRVGFEVGWLGEMQKKECEMRIFIVIVFFNAISRVLPCDGGCAK